MKILITGADGLLGSNLIRSLLERKYDVTALIQNGKNPKTISNLPIKMIDGNILEYETLRSGMEGMDVVIHCAAMTSVWPARCEITNTVNIKGTENVIEACLENNIKRLIYVGTASSFGFGSKKNPGNETNRYKSGKYGLDYIDSKKIAQEKVLHAVKTRKLPAIIVNPTFMIGPFDSGPSSGAMILALYNKKVPGYTNGGKNFINVKDVAIGIANAITLGEIGECYILGNENLSFNQMFQKIGKCIGVKAPLFSLPSPIVKAYGRLNSITASAFQYKPSVTYEMSLLSCDEHYYSGQKAVDELKLPQTSVEFGILECFDWFKENGYLI